jgi:AraC-like DNA-binding protein
LNDSASTGRDPADPADGFDVRSLALGFHAVAHIDWHAHGWGQLVFAASGVMWVETERTAWVVPPTRAIWIPAGLRHRIAFRGETALRTLYLGPTRAAALPGAAAALEVAPLLRELILHILRLGMLSPARPEQDRLAGVLADLLGAARAQDLWLPLPRDARARALADQIHARPEDPRDLADLARTAGASLRTLQRVFPRETGLALEAWRRKARLIYAVERLAAGDSVTDTAYACGYVSVGGLITAFSRQFGMTPGAWAAGDSAQSALG